ncbi:MAG: hypothetical protein ABIP12_06530 [Terriglobales bacterium]
MTIRAWINQRWTQVLLVVLLFSLLENALLLTRNHTLAKKQTPRPRPPSLNAGESIAPLKVKSLDGQNATLLLAEDSLIFIYSAKCMYSRKNFANWRHLESKANNQQVVYLSIDTKDSPAERREFAKNERIDSRVFLLADEKEIARLKVFSVPQTLRVVNGKVKSIDLGLLSEKRTETIREQCDTKT